MTVKQIKHTTIALLLLYVGYYACVSLFVHTHIYNGVVYVHSHPYKKNADDDKKQLPYQTHHHTSTALFALNLLSNLTSFEASSANIVDTPIVSIHIIKEALICDFVANQTCHNFSLRAPPF